MSRGTAIFLDTSIQIARIVHDKQTKERIKQRIAPYDLRVTSLVVRQEFRRRLLDEVVWCLNQLNHPTKPRTFEELSRYVLDHMPRLKARQQKIRLQIIQTIREGPHNDRTERARRFLRALLRTAVDMIRRGDPCRPGSGLCLRELSNRGEESVQAVRVRPKQVFGMRQGVWGATVPRCP